MFIGLLLLPAVLVASPAGDTTAKIMGKVQQIVEDRPELPPYNIYNCEVCLYYQKAGKVDSLLTTTDWNGVFYFRNIQPQRIGLKLRYTGFETISDVYDIEAGDNVFYFSLKKAVKTLDAATVVAEVPLIKRIQDTTVYNTQAIKAGYDESLRQVLEQLPGFSVSDDKISLDGKEVKRTYVNGMQVFGDKVTSAIDALKADEVTQVKVYDQLSAQDRHRGNRNAEKERVLDIITKDLILTMDLATVGLAGGADFTGQGRYAAAATIAHHSERLETHLTAAANNIGQPLEGFVLESTPLRSISQSGPLSSYIESAYAGASVTKYWKNRDFGNKVSFRYNISNEFSKSASTALTEYLEGSSSPAMTAYDTLSSRTVNRKHEVEITFDLNDTPWKSFLLTLQGSIARDSVAAFSGNQTQTDGVQQKRIHQESKTGKRNYSIGGEVDWSNNDDVDWRPHFGMGFFLTNNNSLSWTVDTVATSFLKRELHSDGYGRSINANLGLYITKRLVNSDTHTSEFHLGARSIYKHSRQIQLSVDEFDSDIPIDNLSNSFDYTRHQLESTLITGVNGSKQGFASYQAAVVLNHTYLFTNDLIPTPFTKDKGFVSVASSLLLTGKTYQVRAESHAVTPAIEQISNRVSDANPMVLTAGNPNLKQGYIVNITGQYAPQTKKYKSGNSGNFNFSTDFSFTFNPIVSSIRYFSEETVLDQWDGYVARPGAMLYTYDNSGIPQWSVSARPGYMASVAHNKLRVNIVLDGRLASGPQNFGGEIVPIMDNSAAINFAITYKPSKSFNLTNSFSPSYLNSSRVGELVSERIRFGEKFGLTWYIIRSLKFDTSYRFTCYKYLSGIGSDHYSHYLNAGLDLVLLKDRSLTIGIAGCDLLNSGSLYKTSVSSEKMTQTWTPTYGRNLMARVIYTFKKH